MDIARCWRNTKKIINLGFQIAKAEFKLRNEGSYLGIFWYLLNPILMFTLLLAIFNSRLGADIQHYPPYLMLGIIMFNFFQSATLESTRSIINEHHYLIKSINFPRESLITAIILKNLFSHAFEIALFIPVAAYFKLDFFAAIFYLPALVLLTAFTLGASLLLSSMTVYLVDLGNIWDFALKLIWLGTPIFYAIGGQTRLFYANLANPMYYFITLARDLVVYGRTPDWWLLLGAIAWPIVFLVAGIAVFGKLKIKFAELI
jgi:ABC-type polysaccharide/polyol phosphate export permease